MHQISAEIAHDEEIEDQIGQLASVVIDETVSTPPPPELITQAIDLVLSAGIENMAFLERLRRSAEHLREIRRILDT